MTKGSRTRRASAWSGASRAGPRGGRDLSLSLYISITIYNHYYYNTYVCIYTYICVCIYIYIYAMNVYICHNSLYVLNNSFPDIPWTSRVLGWLGEAYLSYPILSYPYPILILSYPILSYPILSIHLSIGSAKRVRSPGGHLAFARTPGLQNKIPA